MEPSTRRLLVGLSCSCVLSGMFVERAFAAAKDTVYVMANGACQNGSAMWVAGNSDRLNGIIATITQTATASANTTRSALEVSLNPGEEKKLGCEIQDLHPGPTTVQFAWQVQDARYK